MQSFDVVVLVDIDADFLLGGGEVFEGLKRAIEKVLTIAFWQRGAVHFLRNANDRTSHQTDQACLIDLKRMWSCTDMAHARHELGIWVRRWREAPGCDQLETAKSSALIYER